MQLDRLHAATYNTIMFIMQMSHQALPDSIITSMADALVAFPNMLTVHITVA